MADQIDLNRAFQFLQGLYNPLSSGSISIHRLGDIALELMTLKVACENTVNSDASTKAQKDQARRVLEYLDRVEKLVAQMYAVRQLRGSIPYGFPQVPVVITR